MTIEDPIEYLHRHKKGMVNQRELKTDTDSFGNALRAVLREDPDVILIGEMRDLETIQAALTLAETGHLVFGTLHTRNAPQTIDRVVDVFPPHQQEQIRVQLSNTLEAVVAQQLLPRIGGGRCAAIEIMIATSAIRNLIREGKTYQIYSALETGAQFGMQTMDKVLAEMHRSGNDHQGRGHGPRDRQRELQEVPAGRLEKYVDLCYTALTQREDSQGQNRSGKRAAVLLAKLHEQRYHVLNIREEKQAAAKAAARVQRPARRSS